MEPSELTSRQAIPWRRWGSVLAWMGLIFFLSGRPKLPELFESPGFQDIVGHFTVYAVLALLLRWALAGTGVSQPSLWAFGLAFLYALSDEFHQSFVPGRHPDPLDILTDAAGAAVALAWAQWRARREGRAAAPS